MDDGDTSLATESHCVHAATGLSSAVHPSFMHYSDGGDYSTSSRACLHGCCTRNFVLPATAVPVVQPIDCSSLTYSHDATSRDHIAVASPRHHLIAPAAPVVQHRDDCLPVFDHNVVSCSCSAGVPSVPMGLSVQSRGMAEHNPLAAVPVVPMDRHATATARVCQRTGTRLT